MSSSSTLPRRSTGCAGSSPFDLLALFAAMLFVFWTAAGAAWVVGAIFRR